MSSYRGRVERLARKILSTEATRYFVVSCRREQVHVPDEELLAPEERAAYRPDRDRIIRVLCEDGPADPIAELERLLNGQCPDLGDD